MKKQILLLLTLTLSVILIAQEKEEIIVELDPTLVNVRKEIGGCYTINPVYHLTSRNYFHHRNKKYKVKLPLEASKLKDLVIYPVYYAGNSKLKISQSIPILIANYQSQSPQFYVDTNNNLDFSDEQALTFEKVPGNFGDASYRYVTIPISSAFTLQILDLPQKNKESWAKLQKTMRRAKKEKVADSKYWFAAVLLTQRQGSILVNNSTYTLILEDDLDDSFGTSETDFLIINKGKDLDFWQVEKDLQFLIENQVFKVLEIDSKGDFIRLEKLKKENTSDILRIREGESVPEISFQDLDKKEVELQNYLSEDKYTLLYFWGTWCGPCRITTPDLKRIALAHKDKLNIIALANRDKPKNVKSYIQSHKIIWQNGLSNDRINRLFAIKSHPTYVLISPKKKLLNKKISLPDLKALLMQESK